MLKTMYINQTRIKTASGLSLNLYQLWIILVKLPQIFERLQIKTI